MAKKTRQFRTWEVKNKNKKKEYRTSLGTTDYDIPMFGYKSAMFILLLTFGSLLFLPMLFELIGIDYRFPTVVLGGLISGFSVSYSQFFLERHKGFCRNFWIVGGGLSVFAGLVIFLVMYAGILM